MCAALQVHPPNIHTPAALDGPFITVLEYSAVPKAVRAYIARKMILRSLRARLVLNTTVFLGHNMKHDIDVLLLHLAMPNAEAGFQSSRFPGFTLDLHRKIVNSHGKTHFQSSLSETVLVVSL